MYYCLYGKGVQKNVLCREVVPFSEGPLSEVPTVNMIPQCVLYCRGCNGDLSDCFYRSAGSKYEVYFPTLKVRRVS